MNGKNIEKLQSSLHYLEGATEGEGESGGSSLKKMVGKKRKHTVFLEGGRKQAEELHVAKEPLKDVDDDYYNEESGDKNYDNEGNQVQRNELSEKQLIKRQRKERKLERRVAKSRSAAYGEMELRNERLKKLQNAEAHLIMEKQVRVKGRRRKIAKK